MNHATMIAEIGYLDSAISRYLSLSDYFITQGDYMKLSLCFGNIGRLHRVNSNLEEAEIWYDSALSIVLTHKGSPDFIYVELGTIYLERGLYEKARQNFYKVLSLSTGNRRGCYALAELARVHNITGDVNGAIHYGQRAYNCANESEYNEAKAAGLLQVAKAYISLGELKKGEGVLDSVNAIAYKTESSYDIMVESYALMSKIDSLSGNYDDAVDHYLTSLNYREKQYDSKQYARGLAIQKEWEKKKTFNLKEIERIKALAQVDRGNQTIYILSASLLLLSVSLGYLLFKKKRV
jgi:tetratricopeptide (TPR) repeat protein